jgi:glycosyltransferase involved in cell wall biosynthesis
MSIPKNSPKISVVICALNEESNLHHVLPGISDLADEILLVDGHSTDSTISISMQLCPRIKVVIQSGKGKGDAIKQGVREASGDIIVTLDADGQTNPADIMRFVTPLLEGYDFSKGTRLAHGRPPNMRGYRWVGNKILVLTSNVLFGTKYTDVCSGYNAIWKSAFLRIPLTNDGFEMEQEMMVKAKKVGLKVIEVEHFDAGRMGSSSKVSGLKQGFIDFWVIIKARF